MEPATGNEPLGAKEVPRFDTPVRLCVHSYRYRLADTDGLSAKAAIDGIVKAGLLGSDTPKEIHEIRYRQTKIKAPEAERTEITITPVKESE
jgi:hypothetical protein